MDARDRIQSLALVHERLFSSDDYSNIDFGEYARLVIDGEYARLVIVGLVTSFGNSRIEFAIDFSPVIMTVEEAIPAGLILNEALTNILKYAFPPGWAGPERVELRIGIPEGGEGSSRSATSVSGCRPDSIRRKVRASAARSCGFWRNSSTAPCPSRRREER